MPIERDIVCGRSDQNLRKGLPELREKTKYILDSYFELTVKWFFVLGNYLNWPFNYKNVKQATYCLFLGENWKKNKNVEVALTGVAQWVGHHPTNRKFSGSIPGHSTCLGCGPGPQLVAWEKQLIDVSLAHRSFSPSISPSLPPSKNTYIHTIFLKRV